jgi:hypothetical protein
MFADWPHASEQLNPVIACAHAAICVDRTAVDMTHIITANQFQCDVVSKLPIRANTFELILL